MCRRHFRLANETLEEDDDATDSKPTALACVVESGDDVSQLGESQDTLSCFPDSQPEETGIAQSGVLDDAQVSLWKNNTFLNYSKDCCCHCDEKETDAAPLYQCTCNEKLKCRRLWHMDCQNQVLREAGQKVFLRIDPKTFHCSECVNFESWTDEEQLEFLCRCNDDVEDDDGVQVARSSD